MGRNYATGPSPQTVAMTAGFKSPEHVFPKHALLQPPANIMALMFPRVVKKDDGTELNIIQALEWASKTEVQS